MPHYNFSCSGGLTQKNGKFNASLSKLVLGPNSPQNGSATHNAIDDNLGAAQVGLWSSEHSALLRNPLKWVSI